MKSISLVIPVYNEQDNVENLYEEIRNSCKNNCFQYEIIFVDDGSTDQTKKRLKQLKGITLVALRRNFGQTAALDAGIKQSKYEYIVLLDGDGQNDPNDIPKMIAHLEENDYDVVSGWRKNRKDPFLKRFISRGANFLRKILIHDGIHDSGCTLKVFRRECFENLSLYGEMHRFIPALLRIRGFSIGEIVVNHRPRVAGKTKYNMTRTVKGFIDMVSIWFWNKFAVRPLHLLGGLGLVSILLGMFSGVVTLVFYFMGMGMSESAWPLLTAFFLLSGIQLFVSGLIADTLLKNYYETTPNKSYQIKEVIENNILNGNINNKMK